MTNKRLRSSLIPSFTIPLYVPVFLLLILIIFASQTHAASVTTPEDQNKAEEWYQVEVIIFKYLSFSPAETQYEKIQPPTTKNNPFEWIVQDTPLTSNQLPALNKDTLDLLSDYQKLRRYRSIKVLYFRGWKQKLIDGAAATRLIIQGGKYSAPYFELQGNIYLSKRRYLHSVSDLYLVNYDYGYKQTLKEWFLLSDALAVSIPQLLLPELNVNNRLAYIIPKYIAHLHQSIRLKLNELHYMDHPAMGVLMKIEATNPPYIAPIAQENNLNIVPDIIPAQTPATIQVIPSINHSPVKKQKIIKGKTGG